MSLTAPSGLDLLVDLGGLLSPRAGAGEVLAAASALRSGPGGDLVGRLLAPSSRVKELSGALGPADHVPFGLVVDYEPSAVPTSVFEVVDEPRLQLESVVLAVRTPDEVSALRDLPPGVVAYTELPADASWRRVLTAVEAAGFGGVAWRGDHPFSDDRVADTVQSAVEGGLPFTVTGCLDPVRTTNRHGYLNLLAATGAAVSGAAYAEIRRLVGSHDAVDLAVRVAGLPPRTRVFFRSFTAPDAAAAVADLRDRGLAG